MASVATALPIAWKTQDPVWVEQWPLSKEKLKAAEALIEEQLKAGHIEETTSPYNTPIFVVRKKSGKWRLLQDLRAINQLMVPMGPLQCGLPNPNLIPSEYKVFIIDLKDCFFTIPLSPEDRTKFAFTLPTLNNSSPARRYSWVVLPQGMMNSPTLCQYFVRQALAPYRAMYPKHLIYHYMDDILVAASDLDFTHLEKLKEILQNNGLQVAPEKIQVNYSMQYLGHKFTQAYSIPNVPHVELPSQVTIVQLQQFLGHLN